MDEIAFETGMKPEDFKVKTLGKAEIDSPISYSTIRGDGIVSFIDDEVAIPYQVRSDSEPEAGKLFFEAAGPRRLIHFRPEEVTAGIMTCGGLCPGLNDAIRAIVMELHYKYGVKSILGIRFGQQGLDPKAGADPVPLTPQEVKDIHLQGGSVLGTSRGPVEPEIMVETLRRRGINLLLSLGGDGTQKGNHAICREIERRGLRIAVVGVPKTIDNDISFVFRTFGIDTAVTIAREAVRGAHVEAVSSRNAIGLVKVMGRHSGFIAALTVLAANDANFCLIPEISFSLEGENGLLKLLEERLRRRSHAVIVVAEGAGQDLMKGGGEAATYDASGNIRLGDIGFFLKNRIIEHFKSRSLPVDLKYIDPSYMIRSVPANASDSIFAAALGRRAVDAGMAGNTDLLVGYWHGSFTHVPLSLAVSRGKRVDVEGELWRDVLSSTGQTI